MLRRRFHGRPDAAEPMAEVAANETAESERVLAQRFADVLGEPGAHLGLRRGRAVPAEQGEARVHDLARNPGRLALGSVGHALAELLAGLLFGAGGVMAQTETGTQNMPGPGMGYKMEERCKSDPQACEAAKQGMEQRRAACNRDPEACNKQREERRARNEERRKEMRAQCEKDPQACEKRQEERRARRAEHRKEMQAQCDKDPAACQQRREEMRKNWDERCKNEPQKCEGQKMRPRQPAEEAV